MDRLPKHVTLKHLHAFIAVAQESSFTAAARRLYQTQSSLTNLIQQMEGSLGTLLFERTSRRVMLTRVGEEFLPRAIRILHDFEAAVDDVIRYGELKRGEVTVAAAPSAITELLVHAVVEFGRLYPGIRVTLRDESSRRIQESVAAKTADFGLTSRWVGDSSLDFEPCVVDEFGVLYPLTEEWAFLREGKVQWEQLIGCKQVGLEDDTGILSLLRSRIDLPREVTAPFYSASSTTSQAAMVHCGIGLAALPALAAHRVKGGNLGFTLLEGPVVERALCFVTHAHYSLTPMAKALLDIVREYVRHADLPEGCKEILAR